MARRIALFGQAAFGRDILLRLLDAGHDIVAVYTPPEGRRPDPLAEAATERGLRLVRVGRFRRQGRAIPEILAEYRALGAELNVLAYVTAILPSDIVEAPPLGSLCFHPSLLPRYRGGAAIAWQIILGERASGVTIFRPDAGVDTGPIVVERGGVSIDDTDTAGSLYYQKLYPLGVEAMLDAVRAVDTDTAELRPQDDLLATSQGLVTDDVARIDWDRSGLELDRLLRGCDPQPGARARWDGHTLRLYDTRFTPGDPGAPPGTVLALEDSTLHIATQGGTLRAARLRLDNGPKLPAPDLPIPPGTRLI